jgi:hypothetical protein
LALEALLRFDYLHSIFGTGLADEIKGLKRVINIPPIEPSVAVHPTYSQRFSGAAILEGSALFQEMLLLRMLQEQRPNDANSAQMRLVEERVTTAPAYGMVHELFYNLIPDWKTHIELLPALVDLALMGCCDPYYVRPVIVEFQWGDVHPGMRFVIAATAAKEIGVEADDGSRKTYNKLLQAVCAKVGWRTPGELATWGIRWKDEYEALRNHQYDDFVKEGGTFLDVNPYGVMPLAHYRAMDERHVWPRVFMDTLFHFGQLFVAFRPPAILSTDEPSMDFGWLGFYHFHQAMRSIFLGTAPQLRPEFLLPSNIVVVKHGKSDTPLYNMISTTLWQQVGYPREAFV